MSTITDIAQKVNSLEHPPTPAPPDPDPNPIPEEPTPTQPIKPALKAVHFGIRIVETTVGAAQMTQREEAAIARIALRAFRRSVTELVGALEKGTARTKGRPRGSKNKGAASAAPAPVTTTPKRRGRPPKAKTVTFEPPQQAAAQS